MKPPSYFVTVSSGKQQRNICLESAPLPFPKATKKEKKRGIKSFIQLFSVCWLWLSNSPFFGSDRLSFLRLLCNCVTTSLEENILLGWKCILKTRELLRKEHPWFGRMLVILHNVFKDCIQHCTHCCRPLNFFKNLFDLCLRVKCNIFSSTSSPWAQLDIS